MEDGADTAENDSDGTADGTGEGLREVIGTADSEVRDRLSSAVTVVGERSGDLRSQLETLSRRTAETAKPVLESVQDHIENNDIDVTIRDNEIHIEGDDAGLRKVQADLTQAVQGTDVHVEYDREDGINLDIDDGETDTEAGSN